jgi:hypothetical protein
MRIASVVTLAATTLALALAIATGGCSSSGSTVSGDGGVNPLDCPASSPANGSACALAAGTECHYGCDSGGPSTATCTGSKWSVAALEIACVADGGAGDASGDALPPADGPFACGSQTCGATQYCLHPCCGGVAPACEPMPDSGTCPPGTHSEQCQPWGGGTFGANCRQDPCTPPPPSCIDDPSQSHGCQSINPSSHDLFCLCG